MKKDPPSNYPREVVQSLCRLIWETHRVLLQKGPSIPSFKKITCYTWFSQPWLEVRKNECYKKQTQRRYKVQNQLQHKLMLELDCHFVAQKFATKHHFVARLHADLLIAESFCYRTFLGIHSCLEIVHGSKKRSQDRQLYSQYLRCRSRFRSGYSVYNVYPTTQRHYKMWSFIL